MDRQIPQIGNKKMFNPIILDFDGVIVESVSVKTDAFRELFSFNPQYVEEIIEYHLKNGGMSRFDKFKYIYKEIFKEPLTDLKMQELSEKFSKIVMEKVISAPFVPGAEEFLIKYSTKSSLYIVSATPQSELDTIVDRKAIRPYFKKVYGSPEKKQDHLRKIISESGADPDSVLFVGDAVNDWQAAKKIGIHFIARVTLPTKNDFYRLPDVEWIVHDLNELSRYFEE